MATTAAVWPVAGHQDSSAAPTGPFSVPQSLVDHSPLPKGFPAALDTGLAWTGNSFRDTSDYVLRLTEEDAGEIESALRQFHSCGLDGHLVCKDNFPLPKMGPRLEGLKVDLHLGKGFGLIRGLDTARYSAEDLTTIYLGLQVHVADMQGCQDQQGNMLVHIIADKSTEQKATHNRHSTAAITFHNEEAGDLISWLTRSTAAAGGKCIIASAYTVYNVLAATRPDMIKLLARADWHLALPRFHCRPLLFHVNGKVIFNFGRAALLGSASNIRPDDLPKLTVAQMEALEAVESIARATQLEIQTQAGDIHFINNLAVFHRREMFINGAGPEQKRHLVRMRIRDSQLGWKLPVELQPEWDNAFAGKRRPVWHVEPMPDGFFLLRAQPN